MCSMQTSYSNRRGVVVYKFVLSHGEGVGSMHSVMHSHTYKLVLCIYATEGVEEEGVLHMYARRERENRAPQHQPPPIKGVKEGAN